LLVAVGASELKPFSLLPGDEAELGEIRFDDWLAASAFRWRAGPDLSRKMWPRRVAPAAGEGSIVVSFVHRVLAE
jgi:hypothetical protein